MAVALRELEQKDIQRERSTPQSITEAIEKAISLLAPTWDAQDFVAVNPFFGLRDKNFLSSLQYVQAATGSHVLPELDYYKKLYKQGYLQDKDIVFAIEQTQLREKSGTVSSISLQSVLGTLEKPQSSPELLITCLSDCYDREQGGDLTQEIAEDLSQWLAAYFDQGQAVWAMPQREQSLFTAWQELALLDPVLGKDLLSLKGKIAPTAEETIKRLTAEITEQTGIEADDLTNYFFRLLCSLHGWASYIKKFHFEAERDGDTKKLDRVGGLLDLLAIRMSYDALALEKIQDKESIKLGLQFSTDKLKQLESQYILLLAHEQAYRQKLMKQFKKGNSENVEKRAEVQMAFCIDVRSETLRKNIEKRSPFYQTIGFAGFFGLPTTIRGLAQQEAQQSCPVLLSPQLHLEEVESIGSQAALHKKQTAATNHMIKKSQTHSTSCFPFVETMWWQSLTKLFRCASTKKRPDTDPHTLGHDNTCSHIPIHQIPLKTKVALALGTLKNMNLTHNFAPLVIFFGHHAESSNNPQAAGLECGACAGHSGERNASVIVDILNDSEVRYELTHHSIYIPQQTYFLSGTHNTTRDVLSIKEHKQLPATHHKLLSNLGIQLRKAEEETRRERENSFPLSELDKQVSLEEKLQRKSTDWSELRPEWGLAKNASFIIGNRENTREKTLWGTSFLHDYNAEADRDDSTLRLLMTAPMVVAHWINMQYFASTIDPEKFGAGNKSLHNVVGGIGIIEGSRGDLRAGLSEQSVRYNGEYVHTPLRLQVIIEAPQEKIDRIIDEEEIVHDLIENEWVLLHARDPESGKFSLRESNGWLTIEETL